MAREIIEYHDIKELVGNFEHMNTFKRWQLNIIATALYQDSQHLLWVKIWDILDQNGTHRDTLIRVSLDKKNNTQILKSLGKYIVSWQKRFQYKEKQKKKSKKR